MRRFLSVLLLVSAPLAAWAAPPRGASARSPLLEALRAELDRSIARLRLPGYEPPYFLSFTVRDFDAVDVTARLGAIVNADRNRARQAYVEVRVGDYQFDNTADAQGEEGFGGDPEALYDPGVDLPLEDDPGALRATLWLLTDSRYKAALGALHRKRGSRATRAVEDEDLPSFARSRPIVHADPPVPLRVDLAAWKRRARTASARFRQHPDVLDSQVRMQATREVRSLVSSEGTRLVSERTIYGLHIAAVARASDGVLLEHGRDFYGVREADLPDAAALAAAVDRVARELEALRRAPALEPYTGPAILMEEATGVLFHEVIGHRLEGERLSDENEGHTFKGSIGQTVIPAFLDIADDPTLRAWRGVPLNGHYRHDDEGVPAETVKLVEGGVLKTYLTSRRPVTGVSRSNGHGRSEGALDPMARMGNLIVRSSRTVPLAELKRKLVEEARRQGKPFGLIILDISGGSTNTASYGYQAFKGSPRIAMRVDARTGEETLVRGVEIVGTPLAAINKILATSDTMGVFNGFCGAESGYVPVSTVAPAVLLSEIELQRTQRVKQKPTILPPPY